MLSLLEGDAYDQVEVLNRRKDGRIAMIGQHTDLGSTLIIADRNHKILKRTQIDQINRSLKSLGAERALLIYPGPTDVNLDDIIDPNAFTLVQAADLTHWMVERGLGVSHYQTSQIFIDPDWLETLDPSLLIF